MINYMYKIGDLVWIPKKKACGVILSWEVSDNNLMIFQIQYEKNNKTFMKYFPKGEFKLLKENENKTKELKSYD